MHMIVLFITNARRLPINDHADMSSGTRGLKFGQGLHLGLCVQRCSDEAVLLCRLS